MMRHGTKEGFKANPCILSKHVGHVLGSFLLSQV